MKTQLLTALALALPLAAQGTPAPLPGTLPPLLPAAFISPQEVDALDEEEGVPPDPATTAELRAEMEEVLEHYRRTGEARYASPRYRVTMLHLAALHHNLPLVQELLAKGASVNARMLNCNEWEEDGKPRREFEPCDTPLTLALLNLTATPATAAQVRPVAEALLAAGASTAIPGWEGENVLGCCAIGADTEADSAAWEDIALLLLAHGTEPTMWDARTAIDTNWPRLFAAMLQGPAGKELREDGRLQEDIRRYFSTDENILAEEDESAAMLACARALRPTEEELRQTATRQLFTHECTRALLQATAALGDYDELPSVSPAYTDYLDYLLRNGADACEGRQGCCAADFIAICPALQAELTKRGHKVMPPPHRFEPYALPAQLEYLPLMAVSKEEVLAQWDTLAGLFTGEVEVKYNTRGYRSDVRRGLTTAYGLLYRADAERARRLVMELPLWTKPAAWHEKIEEINCLLHALDECESAVFPAAWVEQVLRTAVDAACFYEGRVLLRIAARDDSAEAAELLEDYCGETSAELRGGAWEAKLARHGLPSVHGAALELWMTDHYELAIADLAPEHVVALHAVQAMNWFESEELPEAPDHFVDFHLRSTDADVVAALRRIGAPKAALLCERMHNELDEECGGGDDASSDDADGDDSFMDLGDEEEEDAPDSAEAEESAEAAQEEEEMENEAIYELEEAFAQYLITHEKLFKYPPKAVFRATIPLRPVRYNTADHFSR